MKFDQSETAVQTQGDKIQLWSQGQRRAFEELLDVAETFFALNWSDTGLRARMDPLIVGPSGIGKSQLIRLVCRKLGIPHLRLTYGEWVPMAAREKPHTIQRVHDFVDENPRGIVHVDEIDKFKTALTGEWSTSVFIELFLLLDRSCQQPGRDVLWTQGLQEKLAKSFLIVGTGTWQSIWSQGPRPCIGFHAAHHCAPLDIPAEIHKSGLIPPELMRRFNTDLIVLPPATEEDYREGARIFGLDLMAQDLGIELDYADAAKGGLGARWLEGTLSRLLRRAKKVFKTDSPATDPFSSEQPDWDPDDYPSDAPPF